MLEDGRDRALGRLDAVQICPSRLIVPELGSSWPPIMRSVVVLPQPEGPSSVDVLPVLDVQVRVLDGRDVAGEDAVDVLEDESRAIAARGSGDLWGFGGCAHDSGTFDGETWDGGTSLQRAAGGHEAARCAVDVRLDCAGTVIRR